MKNSSELTSFKNIFEQSIAVKDVAETLISFSLRRSAPNTRKFLSDKGFKAENKVKGVFDISEAVRLMRKGGDRWRLKEYESGQVNIYKLEHLIIHEL